MRKLSFLIICACLIQLIAVSCKEKCMGVGKIKFTNQSTNSAYRIIVDGVSYGNIMPGESKEVSLAARERTVQLVGIEGTVGCPAQQLYVEECEIMQVSCMY